MVGVPVLNNSCHASCVGDVFRGGLHVREAGVNVTRPLVILTADRDSVRFSTVRPWGWLVRQRAFTRDGVMSVKVSRADSWMSAGVEFATTTQGVVTFWTRHATTVAERLAELGWPVSDQR